MSTDKIEGTILRHGTIRSTADLNRLDIRVIGRVHNIVWRPFFSL